MEASAENTFQIGDSVMFTNDYGLTFGPYKITGVTKTPYWKKFSSDVGYYLNCDNPWFERRGSKLKLVKENEDA